MGHYVLMGRKTYESIPLKFRPLPGRINIVLTKDSGYQAPRTMVITSPQEIFNKFSSEEVFIIGGGEIYRLFLPYAQKIYLTRIEADLEGDTYFPDLGERWNERDRQEFPADADHPYPFSFSVLEKAEEAKKVVDLSYARDRGDYGDVLARIQEEGKCPFCPDNFRYHKKPILQEYDDWLITEASWPYPNTQHHFLLLGKLHGETFLDLTEKDWLAIRKLVRWVTEKFSIKGGGLALRFGDTRYSGATVCHIHAHLIVPEFEEGKAKTVNFPIG